MSYQSWIWSFKNIHKRWVIKTLSLITFPKIRLKVYIYYSRVQLGLFQQSSNTWVWPRTGWNRPVCVPEVTDSCMWAGRDPLRSHIWLEARQHEHLELPELFSLQFHLFLPLDPSLHPPIVFIYIYSFLSAPVALAVSAWMPASPEIPLPSLTRSLLLMHFLPLPPSVLHPTASEECYAEAHKV